MTPNRRTIWILSVASLCAAVIVVIVTRSAFGPNEFWLGDEYVKLRQAQSVARLGYTAIVPPASEPWVFELDRAGLGAMQPPWVQEVDGVPQWGVPLPFPAVLSVARRVFGPPGWAVVTMFGVLVNLLLGVRALRRIEDARLFWITALGAVVASPLVINGAFVSEHTLATALAHVAAALLLWRDRGNAGEDSDRSVAAGGTGAGVAAGLAMGAAGWLRPEALVLGGLVATVFALGGRRRRGFAFAAGWAAVVGAFVAHNLWLHGALLGTHAAQMGQRAVYSLSDRAAQIWWHCAWALPEAAVGVAAAIALWRGRAALSDLERDGARLVAAAWVFVLAVPLFVPNAGGVTWGPRYLFVAAPLFIQGWAIAAGRVGWPARLVPRSAATALAIGWCAFHLGMTYVYAPVRVPRVAHHQSAVCGPLRTYRPHATAVANLHYLNHVQGCGAGPVFYTPTPETVSRVLSACVTDCAFAWVTPAVDGELPAEFGLRSSDGGTYDCRSYGAYGMSNLSLCERRGMVRPNGD